MIVSDCAISINLCISRLKVNGSYYIFVESSHIQNQLSVYEYPHVVVACKLKL